MTKKILKERQTNMLNKAICFKCHMKYYDVDGINNSGVKCYPPPTEEDRKQCEIIFEKDWSENKIWCFGLNNHASDEELKQIFGKENWNQPFINPITDKASKFCDYKSEQPK